MSAIQLLFLVVGIFVIVNAGNFLQVFQGKAKIAVATGSRSTSTGTTPSTSAGSTSAPKGQAGS